MKKNGFSAVEVIIIVIVVGIIGVVSWVFLNRPQTQIADKVAKQATKQTESKQEKRTCKGDKTGSDGYFCLIGLISMPIPKEFNGKFMPQPVAEGNTKYQAIVKEERNGTFTMLISKEKAWSGDIDVPYLMQKTVYDVATDELRTADDNKLVPSITIDGKKFYHGSVGDAGITRDIYFTNLGAYFLKVELNSTGYMGVDPKANPDIDLEQLIKTFKDDAKQLTVV